MNNIIQWLDSLISFPQLSWFKYVVAAIIILVVIDAFLNLIFSAINTLVTGGKR